MSVRELIAESFAAAAPLADLATAAGVLLAALVYRRDSRDRTFNTATRVYASIDRSYGGNRLYFADDSREALRHEVFRLLGLDENDDAVDALLDDDEFVSAHPGYATSDRPLLMLISVSNGSDQPVVLLGCNIKVDRVAVERPLSIFKGPRAVAPGATFRAVVAVTAPPAVEACYPMTVPALVFRDGQGRTWERVGTDVPRRVHRHPRSIELMGR